jgi:hypothetical protein
MSSIDQDSTPATVAKVARSLSEAQVNLLFYWPKGLFEQCTYLTLMKKGLVRGREVLPLGLAVRQHLMEADLSGQKVPQDEG